jgi:CheY-like chemotaxis protein
MIRTVLLIEPDAAVRKWIHAQLEKSGFNLLEASDGADALLVAELHRGHIDVIVTDIDVPRVKLVRALLKLRPGVRVLDVPGCPDVSVEDHLAACDKYLTAIKDAARQVSRRQGVFDGGRWRLISTLAAGALIVIAAVTLPMIRQSRSPPFVVNLRAMRGLRTQGQAPSRRPLALHLDMAGLASSPSYRIEIVNQSGGLVWQCASASRGTAASVTMPPQQPGTYFVRVALPSGEILREYGLEIRGTD